MKAQYEEPKCCSAIYPCRHQQSHGFDSWCAACLRAHDLPFAARYLGIEEAAIDKVRELVEAVRQHYTDEPYGPAAIDTAQIIKRVQKELGQLLAKVRT